MAETETPALSFVRKAYEHLKEGGLDEALAALDEALKRDFEDPEVLYALKCLNWWLPCLREFEDDPYGKGLYIFSQMGAYASFLEKLGASFDSCQYAVRRFVFSVALEALERVSGDGSARHDPDLLFYLGRCYKGIGSYDRAAEFLGRAAGFKREDAACLAEFADVNALLGEDRAAKALFREAFFVDPQKVDLNMLESEMIKKLVAHTAEAGRRGRDINEWLPVYGALTGVFSVRRALSRREVSRLVQSVKTLEIDLGAGGKTGAELIPRLLNGYLWLLSHYEAEKRRDAVSEIMLKIQATDRALYERYIK